MNIAQFLPSQLEFTSGSGGRVEGKEGKRSSLLTKISIIKKESGFKKTLHDVLVEVFGIQNVNFQSVDSILQNFLELRLSDKVTDILKILKTNELNDQKYKLLQYIDLILSVSASDDSRKQLLEDIKLIPEIAKGDLPVNLRKNLERIFKHLESIDVDDKQSKEKIKKLLEEFFKDLKLNNGSGSSEIQSGDPEEQKVYEKVPNIREIHLSNVGTEEKNLKVLQEVRKAGNITVRVSNKSGINENLKKVFEQDINAVKNGNMGNDSESTFTGERNVVPKQNILQDLSNVVTASSSSNSPKTSMLKTANLSSTHDVKSNGNTLNSGKTNNGYFPNTKVALENVGTSPKTSKDDLSKMGRVFAEFRFKLVNFEKVKVSSNNANLKVWRDGEFLKFHSMDTEKNMRDITINKKLRINIAQEKYNFLRANNTKELLHPSLKRRQEKAIDTNAKDTKPLKILESLKLIEKQTSKIDNGRNNFDDNQNLNKDKSMNLQLKNSVAYDLKTIEVNEKFSRQVSSIVEKMVQKDQNISTNLNESQKPQIEIQRVVIRLHPPEFGEMELTVVKNGKNIEVSFGVASELVKDTIERNLGHLDQRLKELGFNLERLNFEVKDRPFQTMEEQFEDNPNQDKNYQESNQQNNNHERDKHNRDLNSTGFFDEIFEKEVMGDVE